MLFLAFFTIVLLFGVVLLFGAPYLPTRRRHTDAALDLLDLRPGQTMFELGCGDGRVLRVAAQRGLHVVGYELNPLLVAVAFITTWKYRQKVKIRWGNFWQADLSKADGIYVFLLDRFMPRLNNKITAAAKVKKAPIRLASFTFQVPNKRVSNKRDGIFLYEYEQ